ncbi:hypothetical protein ACE3I0_02475 [Enterobacter hormaechei subsp. hoffmannii]
MMELTPRQNEVFEAIKVHIEKAGFPPTMLVACRINWLRITERCCSAR